MTSPEFEIVLMGGDDPVIVDGPGSDEYDLMVTTVEGPPGPATALSIGEVVGGAVAGATITGTPPAQVLNLTLPKGEKGADSTVPGPPGAPGGAPLFEGALISPLYMSPESSKAVVIPYFTNDLAYNRARGGQHRVYYDGVEQPNQAGNVDRLFEPTATAWSVAHAGITEIAIEIDAHRNFQFGTKIGYAVNEQWRAKTIKIEYFNTTTGQWVTALSRTNVATGELFAQVNLSQAASKFRYTFSDWAQSTNFRIGQLFIIAYNSDMGAGPFMSRAGGAMYGPITSENSFSTTLNPTLAGHLTRKAYVDAQIETRVAQTTTGNRIYGTGTDGTDQTRGLSSSPTASTLAFRTPAGTLKAAAATEADELLRLDQFNGHKHGPSDLQVLTGATVPSATTFYRGDGQWIVPTNTTYSALTNAEFTTATATTTRGVSALALNQQINQKITGATGTAPTATGQAIARAADGPAVRALIGAIDAPYVDTQVAALVAAAPTTLDTLDEIAAALGDDPNFATTITALIGTKAPLAAPALTGAATLDGQALVKTNDARLTNTRTPTDNTVATAKIVDGAVTSAKIADSTIVDGDIAPAAGISVSKLGTGRVTGAVNGVATSLTVNRLTAAQFAALGTKDPNTIYVVVG